MKVTITADTGAQDIEITRCPDRHRTADPIAVHREAKAATR